MVDRADDDHVTPGRRPVSVADPAGGPGGDAVLGVEDAARPGTFAGLSQNIGQPGLEGVDGVEHPILERGGRRRGAHDRVRQRGWPEEPGGGIAEGHQVGVDPFGPQRLTEGEGVDQPAPGPCRMADEQHPGRQESCSSTRFGRRVARAAAARAARPAVGGTMQPASTRVAREAARFWGSPSVPST